MSLFDEHGKVLVSASRLKTWQECPMKWKAIYIDEKRTPPTPALVFGTAIHSALEAFHRARWMGTPVTAAELEGVFAQSLEAEAHPIGSEPIDVGEDFQRQASKLIELYLERHGNDGVAAAELSLTAPLFDDAQLVGVIDLITDDRRVVDLKSSARGSDLFDLAVSHSVQLDAYRWLMQHNAGHEPNGLEIRLLVRKKQPELQTYRLPQRKGFDAFLELCQRYVAFVKEAHQPHPRPNLFCGENCPAYVPCRAYHGLEVA